MKRNIKPYKVISWNFNHDDIEYYDIMPFLIDSYKKIKKNKPKTFDEIKEFIINESRYRFWSRCEYEIAVGGIHSKHPENFEKIDAYYQLEMNLDHIVDYINDYLEMNLDQLKYF